MGEVEQSHWDAALAAFAERVYRHGLSDGWRCNQRGHKSAPVAFDEECHYYVLNGALAKSIEMLPIRPSPVNEAQG